MNSQIFDTFLRRVERETFFRSCVRQFKTEIQMRNVRRKIVKKKPKGNKKTNYAYLIREKTRYKTMHKKQ